jgi:hypothetical protein
MGRRPAAAVDEEAELRALSAQAEQSRRAVAETADALVRVMSARARARARARISLRLAVIALPAVLVLGVGAVYLLRRRSA